MVTTLSPKKIVSAGAPVSEAGPQPLIKDTKRAREQDDGAVQPIHAAPPHVYRLKTDLPLENVSTIGMNSSWAGSAVSGFSPRITRSACFPTVIEPFVSYSKY